MLRCPMDFVVIMTRVNAPVDRMLMWVEVTARDRISSHICQNRAMIQRTLDINACNTVFCTCWACPHWNWCRQTINACNLTCHKKSGVSAAAFILLARPHACALWLAPVPTVCLITFSTEGPIWRRLLLLDWPYFSFDRIILTLICIQWCGS